MNETSTERLRDDIHTSKRITIDATGVARIIFTSGSIRIFAVRDRCAMTASADADATEMTKPSIIRRSVKRTDDQNSGRRTISDKREITQTGDGRNSSSPIAREASSHTISQNAIAPAFLALSSVVEVIPWNSPANALRILREKYI